MKHKLLPKFYNKIARVTGELPPGLPLLPPALGQLLSWVKGVQQNGLRLSSAHKLGDYPLTITESPGVYFSDQTCYFVHPDVALGSRPFNIEFQAIIDSTSTFKTILGSSFGRGDLRIQVNPLGGLGVYWYDANNTAYKLDTFNIKVIDAGLITIKFIKTATGMFLLIPELNVDMYQETSTNWYTNANKVAIGALTATNPDLTQSAYFKIYNLKINESEYKFCEGSGDIIFDVSGNGKHLILGSTASSDTIWVTTTDDFSLIDRGYSDRENFLKWSEDISQDSWVVIGGATVNGNTVTTPAAGDGISQSGISNKQKQVAGVTFNATVTLDGTAGETVDIILDDGVAPVTTTVTLPGTGSVSITTDATTTDVILKITSKSSTGFTVSTAHVYKDNSEYVKSEAFAIKGYQAGVDASTDALGNPLLHRKILWNEAPLKYNFDAAFTDIASADSSWNFWYTTDANPILRNDTEFNFDSTGFGQYFFKKGSKVGLAVYNAVLTGPDRANARAFFEETFTLGVFNTTATSVTIAVSGDTWDFEHSGGISRNLTGSNTITATGEFYMYCSNPTGLSAPSQSLDWTSVPSKFPADFLTIDLSGNNLSQTAVDDLMNALDKSGGIKGTVDISGGTNAIPTTSAVASLISKGWTITTNQG